jgi:hypothetical protein
MLIFVLAFISCNRLQHIEPLLLLTSLLLLLLLLQGPQVGTGPAEPRPLLLQQRRGWPGGLLLLLLLLTSLLVLSAGTCFSCRLWRFSLLR